MTNHSIVDASGRRVEQKLRSEPGNLGRLVPTSPKTPQVRLWTRSTILGSIVRCKELGYLGGKTRVSRVSLIFPSRPILSIRIKLPHGRRSSHRAWPTRALAEHLFSPLRYHDQMPTMIRPQDERTGDERPDHRARGPD